MPRPSISSTTSTITDINIEIPSTLSVSDGDFSCALLNQAFSEDYVSLLLSKDVNTITCTAVNNIVQLSNLSSLISNLGTDDFLRLSIFRLKNANISTTNQIFKVSFLDRSTGTGSILSSGSVYFPIAISSPPLNLQINTIATASSKLLVQNQYTFNLTTVTGADISINSQSSVALVIAFPK